MAGTGDSSSGSGSSVRAGSLDIRRFGDTYQFEVDLPSAGSYRPTIWGGSQRIDPQAWSAVRAAFEAASKDLLTMAQQGGGTRTQVMPQAASSLERLGKLLHQHLLPDDVKEELSRYIGALLLATDDPTVPWELLHDGRDYLGLRHPLGRRLVVSGRRRSGSQRAVAATSGALLIGDPNRDLPEADRELDTLADLFTPLGPCTVIVGPQASKRAVAEALASGGFAIVHYAGPLHVDADEPRRSGLLLSDGQVLTASELESTVTGEPFVFVNGCGDDAGAPFIGVEMEVLARALAGAGARGFVGTLWPVHDAGSRQVAIEFYRRITEGIPAGEALRQARAAVRARRPDEPSWSSFVLYGDPGLQVMSLQASSAVTLRPRARFGPFVLEEEIGRGGMGVVWKAYQPSLDRYVALKFLPAFGGEVGQSQERFRREARVVARLRHPNVLQVHDFGEEQGHLFLVTEYVAGGTFQDVLRREGKLPLPRALQLLGPVAGALDHLHKQNIIHRDVKPSNILLELDGAPVLADCGVARLLDEASHMTGTGAVVGTPSYMSPEQAAGQEAGPASDQYSFGVMIFEAVTGRPPFEGKTPVATALAHLQQDPPNPRLLNPDLPPAAETALLRVLSKRPEERYPSVQAFVEVLRETLAPSTAPIIPPHPVRPTPPPTEVINIPAARPSGPQAAAAVQTPPPRTRERERIIPPTPQPAPLAVAQAAAPVLVEEEPTSSRSRTLVPTLIGIGAVLAALAFVFTQLSPFSQPETERVPTVAPTSAVVVNVPTVVPTTASTNAPLVVPSGAPTEAPTAVPAPTSTTVLTATPVPATATPLPPTATPVPPIVSDWNAVLARLDSGLWTSDLSGAASELENYLKKYQGATGPTVDAATDKLYAATIELGKRAVDNDDFSQARGRYTRAAELRPSDPLAQGELKKIVLWLDGDEAFRKEDWDTAVAKFGELAQIDASFGNAEEKLLAAQVELRKTWTPTPVPPPPPPAQQYVAPAPAAPRAAPAPAPRPAPAPAPRSAPAPAPAPAPAAPPPSGTKPPFVPGTQ